MATQSVSILGQGVKVLGRPHPQQGEVDDQHKAWKQERNEKPLFAKEADILQHGQQYDGDYLSVSCGKLTVLFLCCRLLGQQHQSW